MAASNPEVILRKLNEQLTATVELTVIGRAALILGYDPPILGEDAGQTFDVDVVIPSEQEQALDENEEFWSALEKTNYLLETTGLYLGHIFLETQIILGETWKERRVRIVLPGVNNLVLFRPSGIDLLLSKLARADDPLDRADIVQLIQRERFPQQTIEAAFSTARCPNEPDLVEQFEKAKTFVRSLYESNPD